MDKLLEELKKTCDEFENFVKDACGYSTSELLKLDGEEFTNAVNKLTDKLHSKKDEEFEKEVEEKKKDINFDGQYFKVSECSKDGNKGICVEARGDITTILMLVCEGLANMINENRYRIKSIDGLLDTIYKNLKDNVK